MTGASMPLRRRLAWLLACAAAGGLAGVAGSHLTGHALWYAAIPAAIALGWLFIADPTTCEPPGPARGGPPAGAVHRRRDPDPIDAA